VNYYGKNGGLSMHRDRFGIANLSDAGDQSSIETVSIDTAGMHALCIAPSDAQCMPRPSWPRLHVKMHGICLYSMVGMQLHWFHGVIKVRASSIASSTALNNSDSSD